MLHRFQRVFTTLISPSLIFFFTPSTISPLADIGWPLRLSAAAAEIISTLHFHADATPSLPIAPLYTPSAEAIFAERLQLVFAAITFSAFDGFFDYVRPVSANISRHFFFISSLIFFAEFRRCLSASRGHFRRLRHAFIAAITLSMLHWLPLLRRFSLFITLIFELPVLPFRLRFHYFAAAIRLLRLFSYS